MKNNTANNTANSFFSAPSNIALIKYMGKTDSTSNIPTNGSLSYTLSHLKTFVRLTEVSANEDRWAPWKGASPAGEEFVPFSLSAKGQERFLNHFRYLKTELKIKKNFLVESANNFPSDCGLASSASSFAALTLAAVKTFDPLQENLTWISDLSRKGSGSSCRSFFAPYSLWQNETAEVMKLPEDRLHHLVAVIEETQKEVSSSEAHRRVITSPHFKGRPERADLRLKDLVQALRFNDWHLSRQIVWDEFQDMHRLFETSEIPFTYRTTMTHEILDLCQKWWNHWQDGPLVTMDAGANIHFLFRNDQIKVFQKYRDELSQKVKVIAFSAHERNSDVH